MPTSYGQLFRALEVVNQVLHNEYPRLGYHKNTAEILVPHGHLTDLTWDRIVSFLRAGVIMLPHNLSGEALLGPPMRDLLRGGTVTVQQEEFTAA